MQDLLEEIARRLSTRACAALIRRPFLDPNFPESSDLDVLAFADVDELYPERWLRLDSTQAERSIDVTWLPTAWLEDPEQLAMRGLIGHRLLTSEPLFWRSEAVESRYRSAQSVFYAPHVQARRLAGFFEMGSLTVREIGITWEFPALALFWLQMAYVACLAAALDGRRRLCPNVYTQPFAYLTEIEDLDSDDVWSAWRGSLRLDEDPSMVASAVERVHRMVASRFAEPSWPDAMRATTRFEYHYWLSGDELRYRVRVAEEMCRRGAAPAAVHYLRFYAYALARLPIVHARAREGRDVSFLRPEQAVLPNLQRHCPEIVEDLNIALAGGLPATVDLVRTGLATLHDFRDRTLASLRASGVPAPALTPWLPFERAERCSQLEASCPI